MQSRIKPDRQLSVRMGVTIFFLGLLYLVFAAALVVLLKSVVLIVVILGALLFAQYWYSDRIALAALKGHIVTPEEYPQLHAVLDRLCSLADMPKPKVAVADLDVPNAFATGRNADHAVVCVTTGILGLLDEKELEGVLAHELTHVAHRDVAVITIASFLGVVAGLMMRFTLYSQVFGRRNQNTAMVIMAIMVVSTAVYAISFVLIRALSRYRELAADRDGAILTGQPSQLASALVKLSDSAARIPHRDLRSVQAFNAFFISPVGGGRLAGLFSTHPKLERRLDQLARITEQLGRPV
ncbi:zinc metalloprotease HtpX [Catenulispora sp. NF23]|uniref:zinc metalloprotease HtpX n=1 Tax=Catenulispora pinistramenti TaxID=2705254 RepID=UPI001BAAD9CE|nr:zinc metalloprotease HtpX [Catenulispora pinistramenti]MBS2535242.1 zinc metalloprotease HtpX [Catenulispora pinistramenti]